MLDVSGQRLHSRDDRAHADANEGVGGKASLAHRSQDTDVGESPSPSAAEHEPKLAPKDVSDDPMDVALVPFA